MELSRIEQLIQREILDNQELDVIAIDKTDIDTFRSAYAQLDARMSMGDCEDLCALFSNALTEVRCDNRGKLSGLLFVLKISPENVTLRASFMAGIADALNGLDSDVDVIWGVQRDSALTPDQVKCILLAGFND